MPSTSDCTGARAAERVPVPSEHDKLCVIIGSMKAGTSSLYYQMITHPAVCASLRKEPQFFSDASQVNMGVGNYLRLFPNLAPNQWACEASTNYTKAPDVSGVPQRLSAMFPEARLLYLVRHPVHRILSEYLHNLAAGRERRSPSEAILGADQHYLHLSRYAYQLGEYLKYFRRDQIQVVVFEEYVESEEPTLARVFRFLGIDDRHIPPNVGQIANATSRKSQDAPLQRWLASLPGYGRVPWRLRNALRQRLQKPLPLRRDIDDPQLHTQVLEKLAADRIELEEYLGREITRWRRTG